MKCLRLLILGLAALCAPLRADLVISGNDGKLDLSPGKPTVLEHPTPDSITLLDFDVFPPRATSLAGVSNSVLGPPTNVAIAPDEKLALVASSFKLNRRRPGKQMADRVVRVLDLTGCCPRVVSEAVVGRQPSGLSITRDGRFVLVANRGDGTVSLLELRRKALRPVARVEVCGRRDEPCDVQVNREGTLAMVTVRVKNQVRFLRIRPDGLDLIDPPVPVNPDPYRCAITPDGKYGLIACGGPKPALDGITVIDLTSQPFRSVGHFEVGDGMESFCVSPDGRLIAAVIMTGSNLAPDDPKHTEHGEVVLLAREGAKLTKVQSLPVGRVPEGVTFSPDGRYVIVQNYVARELAFFAVKSDRLEDTGQRLNVPGMPASIRAAERPLPEDQGRACRR